MKGVFNEYTGTVHKHEPGASEYQTECGVSYNLPADQLRSVPVVEATTDYDADRCGRCFTDAGGY